MAGVEPVGWLVGRRTRVPSSDDWLIDSERRAQQRYTVPKRRADWRLGRWTAKHAVSAWLATTGRAVAPRAIGVLPRGPEDGFPVLEGIDHPVPSLSLSHRDGSALCAVTDGSTALGCDIERIEPRGERFVRDWFTEAEHEQIAGAEPFSRDELVTLVWCAKESVLKAVGEGLRRDTRSVEVDLGGAHGVPCPSNGWRPLSARDLDGGRFGCWARRDGAHLLVVATTGRAARRPLELTATWST